MPQGGEPEGDLGERGKTWSPGGEQGISNRPGDKETVNKAANTRTLSVSVVHPGVIAFG